MVPEGRSAAPEVKEQSPVQPSPRPPRIFKSKEQLMLRANSLKKALRQIIDQTEKGEMWSCLCGQPGNGGGARLDWHRDWLWWANSPNMLEGGQAGHQE